MEKEIYNYLLSKKELSKFHVQGMLANIFAESNFDPAADETGDGKNGIGLFQHTFPARKNALIKAVPDWKTNWKGQIDFALQEQEMKSYLNTKFTDKNEAATFFMNKFEIPREDVKQDRIIKQKNFLENYSQSKVTKENKKIARIESFYAQENLSKLANMTPAQAVEYHQGVYDKELAREKFARESVAGGSNQLDYEILGDITETTDYYKFKFDAKTDLPIFGDSTVSAGMTTYSSKADRDDPKTEIRAGFTKQLGKDTSIAIHGSKTNESGQLDFKFTSKY